MTRSVVPSTRAHFGNRRRGGFRVIGGNANSSRRRRLVRDGGSPNATGELQLLYVAPPCKWGHRRPRLRQGAALECTRLRLPNSQRGPPLSVVCRPAPGPWRPATCTARMVRPTQRRSCLRASGSGCERPWPTSSWASPRRPRSRRRWRRVVGGQPKSRPPAAAAWTACRKKTLTRERHSRRCRRRAPNPRSPPPRVARVQVCKSFGQRHHRFDDASNKDCFDQ